MYIALTLVTVGRGVVIVQRSGICTSGLDWVLGPITVFISSKFEAAVEKQAAELHLLRNSMIPVGLWVARGRESESKTNWLGDHFRVPYGYALDSFAIMFHAIRSLVDVNVHRLTLLENNVYISRDNMQRVQVSKKRSLLFPATPANGPQSLSWGVPLWPMAVPRSDKEDRGPWMLYQPTRDEAFWKALPVESSWYPVTAYLLGGGAFSSTSAY